MRCGDSLLIPAPGSGPTPHLWIILTEPDPICAIVSLSTLRFDKDQTVVLMAGEHPFLIHQTAVLYRYAKLVDIDHLEQQILDGRALKREPCSAAMLKLVQDGVFASPFVPERVQRFCRTKLR